MTRHGRFLLGALAVFALAVLLSVVTLPTPVAEAQITGENWTCSVDDVGATLTRCKVAAPGYRLFLTGVSIVSTTATAGQYLIRYGTGTNCGTGTTSLLPSAASVVRFGYVANTLGTSPLTLSPGVPAAKSTDICILCVATNTCTVQMTGYAAP